MPLTKTHDGERRPAWQRLVPRLVVPVVLAWVVVAFIQGALAWGFIGMPKPMWFIVLSYAVWAGPPVVAAVFVVLILRTS